MLWDETGTILHQTCIQVNDYRRHWRIRPLLLLWLLPCRGFIAPFLCFLCHLLYMQSRCKTNKLELSHFISLYECRVGKDLSEENAECSKSKTVWRKKMPALINFFMWNSSGKKFCSCQNLLFCLLQNEMFWGWVQNYFISKVQLLYIQRGKHLKKIKVFILKKRKKTSLKR